MSRVLVTGATGTFGRCWIRRALTDGRWDQVVAFSRDEVKQAALHQEFGKDGPRLFLGDVRDGARLALAFRGVDTVIHAAALKRVDAGSYSPSEMIATNVLGTLNVVNAAIHAGAQRVVVLSSDKCVNATNVYGKTKACTSPETLVLTSDLLWKSAGDVVVGDMLIGVDEHQPGYNSWRKLRIGTVSRVVHFVGPRIRVETSRGSIVVSHDHPFLTRGVALARNFSWLPANALSRGMVIKYIGRPWLDRSDSWLAGLIDGEGFLDAKVGRLLIGQNVGLVLERIQRELAAFGVKYHVGKSRKGRPNWSPTCIVAITRINDVLHLLGSLRPTRMAEKISELLDGHLAPGAKEDAIVEHVDWLENGQLVGLTTGIGTLITDGYVSHNCAEDYATHANSYGWSSGTKIAAVRYGNIIGSRGSVIGIWRDQVARNQPVTLTDRRMTRFIMTIEAAVDLVLHALDEMQGGEVFVPVLPSAHMTDLARAVAPTADYPIVACGIRPGGEKLHESLLNEEEPTRTRRHNGCYVIAPSQHEWTADPQWSGELVDPALTYRSDGVDQRWLSVDELRGLMASTEACR